MGFKKVVFLQFEVGFFSLVKVDSCLE